MEVVTGALPSVISKLGDLLVGEYNLQKGVKGEIRFLKSELESMKGALEKVSGTPPDQLDIQDKIWARDLRELSYDIEDSIDAFMISGRGHESAKLHVMRKLIDRSVGLFRKAKIRHGIASEIKDIKSRIIEVHQRRLRYGVDKPKTTTMVDPRLFAQYTDAKELVGIDETRDELIKVLMDGNGVPLQQGKIASIVGFGGLGKTTLAKAVYEKISGQFDCCAVVSVSQTPDLMNLFKGLLYDLSKTYINEEILDESRLINLLREFLKSQRYLIVIDDIWDILVWRVIKCAFPDNDVGYIVISTTRNINVAEEIGGAYNLKPLSEENSRILMYRRVFHNENYDNVEDIEKCPIEELAEVSNKILKKCAGVPLAVITMASLLARKARNKMDWYDVYHSIGTGLEHNLDVENMRKILSFSYYDMPSHMRTCLLYLGMFSEDYHVEKDRLIWMWIAEGFIQCEEQGNSLFVLGESYFNELINRSMIQPTYDWQDMIDGCHVHDMVLDLICSISSEANFFTILNGKKQMSPLSKIRRLSFQKGKEDDSLTLAPRSLQQVRSVIVLRSSTSQIPAISSFHVLRVLDLQHCDLGQGYYLNKCIGNLIHLRYLGLSKTYIMEVPEEIGNLQYLQVLNIRATTISCLSSNIVQLKHLKCLNLGSSTMVPIGIGSLTSLEELSDLKVVYSNKDIIEELGQLTELRVLNININLHYVWNDKLVECLPKLQKIQDLTIFALGHTKMSELDAWVAPRCLRRLDVRLGFCFQTLPAWINPSHLPILCMLSIFVRELQQADLDILGKLPALRDLRLLVDQMDIGFLGEFIVGAGSFTCLRSCDLTGLGGLVLFEHGAMPLVRNIELMLPVQGAREIASSHSGVLDLGLGNLASLEDATVNFYSQDFSNEQEKDELVAALRHGIKMHPNRAILDVEFV